MTLPLLRFGIACCLLPACLLRAAAVWDGVAFVRGQEAKPGCCIESYRQLAICFSRNRKGILLFKSILTCPQPALSFRSCILRRSESQSISKDISKLETGKTGASFDAIAKLADALNVDPATFFSDQIETGATKRPAFSRLIAKLARLTDEQLVWIEGVVSAALQSKA